MRCARCGNEDTKYFYHDRDVWYCRKCVQFSRLNVGEVMVKGNVKKRKIDCRYILEYPLTDKQKIASDGIMKYLNQHQDVLVYAACGAGKTELTMEAIQTYLRQGKKVGFAISRRQVVLEIRERMAKAFPMLNVICVCEGYTDIVDGDLIICTMHQLYRYHQCFDLLIMDEVDAYPFRGNLMLANIAKHACVGEMLMLTATPDEDMLMDIEKGNLQLVSLFARPHGYPLVEPKVYKMPLMFQILYMFHFLNKMRKQNIQTLIFVPTIQFANTLVRWMKLYYACESFSSKTENKEEILKKFQQHKYECLITTTVLERGITIAGIYVLILSGDHAVFNEASLIQMIGRVGRSIHAPSGEGVILCRKKTKDIKRCVHAIQMMNQE